MGARRGLVGLVAALVASLATIAAIAPAGPVTAAEGEPPPASFVGTWSDNMSIVTTQGQGRPASQARLDDLEDAGVGLVRQYIWWDRIETSPGTYDWGVLDAVVRDAADRGLAVLPTLLYTPSFYSSKPPDSTSRSLFPPADPQKLADFAAAMVERYGPLGTFWGCTRNPPFIGDLTCPEPYRPFSMYEVWNEPDYPTWWKGDPDPVEYLDLLAAVHTSIKDADPSAQVVLGSLTNAGAGLGGGYLDQLYALGAKDHFDVLAVNAYARDVGAMMAFVHGARDIATEHGDAGVPMLVTEYGWATGGTSPYITTTESCQAALLHTATSELIRRRDELGIIGVVQFQWHDVPVVSGPWPHYAGVRRADGSAKPARAAFAAAIAEEPAPSGATLAECGADRQSLDGRLQALTVATSGSGSGTVTSSPSGISCATDCDHQFQPGQVVTLTATPATGSRVVDWEGAECTGATCTLTMHEARAVTVELSDSAPPGTYQENNARVEQTGTWRRVTSSRDRAGASERAANRPATAALSFYGERVRWISRRTPDSGRNAVYVDGVRVAVVNRFARPAQYRQRVFDSGPLPLGEHTVRIEHTGNKDRRAVDDNVWLDAFVVS